MKTTKLHRFPKTVLFFLGIMVASESAVFADAVNGACCFGDGSCLVTSGFDCALQGGFFIGELTNCADTPCTGACCLRDGTCDELAPLECEELRGISLGFHSDCSRVLCAGACCMADGSCEITGETGCADTATVFHGTGSDCLEVSCVGACCLTDGTCEDSSEPLCVQHSAIFRAGTDCSVEDCDGACCLTNGDCFVTGELDCEDATGTFVGFADTCETFECRGACCLPDKNCIETGEHGCANVGGTYEGGGTTCSLDCPTQLGTAFSYQGQLKRSGKPLNGTADFLFTLFLSEFGDSQVGATQALQNIQVINGLFTARLDFGANALNGNARWLAVEVRAPHDPSNTVAYTPLGFRQPLTPSPYALQTRGVFVDEVENVGIGTKSPTEKLHLVADSPAMRLQDSGDAGYTVIRDDAAGRSTIRNVSGQGQSARIEVSPVPIDELSSASVGFFRDTDTSGPRQVEFHRGNDTAELSAVIGVDGADSFLQAHGGDVGIGTTNPLGKLHVKGGPVTVENVGDQAVVLNLAIERGWAFKQDGTGAATALKLQSVGGGGNKDFVIETDGNVGVGTTSPQAKLHVRGTTRTDVIEIMGADLAERFPLSEQVEPGMVVVIDPQNPGRLRMSRKPFDRNVAGIVAGANNFSTGAVLGSTSGGEDQPAIALSGRVYCWCDATQTAIQVGDLLTTSGTPGHAMKADDFTKSQGAILGKAMTILEKGRTGLVLVLVTLQ